MIFSTIKNGVLGERLRITGVGSFGIGNNDPTYQVSVKDTRTDGTGVQLHLWNSSVDNTSGNVWSGIRFTGSTADYETAEIKGWRVHPGTGLNSLSINTGGVERMVMSSGGVGIGTNNPQSKLEVAGTISQTVIEYPTIRPTLDLNFAATKVLDDRITFTRDSIGTYVGEDGLIKYASNNVPRFDHDPITRESLGLLIEESRTNKVSNSITMTAGGTGSVSTNTTETTGSRWNKYCSKSNKIRAWNSLTVKELQHRAPFLGLQKKQIIDTFSSKLLELELIIVTWVV